MQHEHHHKKVSEQPSAWVYTKRYLYLIVGLFIMSIGIVFAIHADLGTSPVSSPPYVVSLMTPLTVGNVTIIWHAILILCQILILRKNYKPIQLLQLVIAVILGYFTDWMNAAIGPYLVHTAYWQQWIFCLIGIAIVAVGVGFEVTADAVPLAGEGFILAVCSIKPIKFSTMKIIFDVSVVIGSAALSLLVFHNLQGVREGSIAAALLVGVVVKQTVKPLGKFAEKYLD